MRFFLLGFFLALQLQAIASEWHLVKENTLSTPPAQTQLRSATFEKADEKNVQETAQVDALVFPSSAFHLRLIDSPARNKKLAEVMEGSHFLAGVNGGYFHPNGTPLGLVIIQGKKLHPQETAKLLSGLFVATSDQMFLLRAQEKLPKKIEEALQAGPFLIDHGTTVSGLESTRVARRTFLATDNHAHWIMGVISPVTLAEASQILLAASSIFLKTTKIERALNLDGGSSSAFWVDTKPTPFFQEEFGTVRTFLVLLPSH